ncbi:hypothetical protein PR202_ga18523 [Eleusine coracana subsp. coracana]|uniref:Peptidase A1 domain-containing protein n=1 Tax=Eleusine coracana subsp. coracana TaxID=191504 RepID=A0AAV5CU09_ELECO|nr:hypothetical protein QOZ80_4AG0298800 [Eleusine coracana subsp. coracana]GJN01270.1 hypothetical protein PR202_ga18523 [Eleusine coracana subsp. coracana]
MAQAPLLPLLLLLLVVAPGCLSASTPTILPLYRHLPQVAETAQQHPLWRLAAASLARASHLKQQHGGGGTTTKLYSHSYGGYAFTAWLGTPAQQVAVLLDTGSQLTWVPCTSRYQCRNCSFSSSSIPTFIPKRSSTSRLIGCHNPSCQWVHSSNKSSSNSKCGTNNNVCPPYAIVYGSGSTAGLLIADTLRTGGSGTGAGGMVMKKNLVLGCSLVSVHQPPSGLAGFGRGAPSLPAQLGLNKFSYCLLSRRFDDNAAVSGQLVLGDAADHHTNLQYVPLLNNKHKTPAAAASPYSVYYYLALTGITVAGKPVRLPQRAFVAGANGGGGAIIDSGTTFTYLDPTVFQPVAAAVISAVRGRYNRSREVENALGLRPCFALPRGPNKMELPELSLQFKGGAQMRLPLENYFVVAGITHQDKEEEEEEEEAICLAVITDIANGPVGGGPAIILGSFQQQNYLLQYDLQHHRIGFTRQPCASSTS